MVASRNPSTDITFFILLSLVFTAVLARDVAILGKFLSITFTLIFGFFNSLRSNNIYSISYKFLDDFKNKMAQI